MTRINALGTMADSFRIGKTGPTILQGDTTPDNAAGLNGDLYVRIGNVAQLYIKQPTGWTVSSDPGFGYVRQAVTQAGTTVLNAATSHGAVNVAASATVQLMAGQPSKTVVIKDEGGFAASYPITVTAGSGGTIDGQSEWTIDLAYGALTLIYGGSEWHIIAAITSAPFNQISL